MTTPPAPTNMAEPSEQLAVTLSSDGRGVLLRVRSGWTHGEIVGGERLEVRVASAFNDERIWRSLGDNHVDVGSARQLQMYLATGGHALVDSDLAASLWEELTTPIRCQRHYDFMPYYSIDHLPPYAKQRHARGELRQWVFQRDHDRCRVCNRSPDDYLDIVLEMHHVMPVELGGLTVEDNLIVLCGVCHAGMASDDHERREDLYEKIAVAAARLHRIHHERGVGRYRSLVRRVVGDVGALPPAVLPLQWSDEISTPMDDPRARYMRSCYDDVTRWYSRAGWHRLVKSVLHRCERAPDSLDS